MSPHLFIFLLFRPLYLSASVSTSHQISHPHGRPFLPVSAVYTSPSITAHNLIWKGKWPYEKERERELWTGSICGKKKSVDVEGEEKSRICFVAENQVAGKQSEAMRWDREIGCG